MTSVQRVLDGTADEGPSAVAALQLRDITVRFGGITALDGVALDVGAGEVCGLIGPNGAGKTTLFDVISGVRASDDGTVTLEGQDVTRKSSVQRSRRGLHRTFQRVQAFGWLSVEDNVLTALEWRGGGGGLLADLVAAPSRRHRERDRRQRVAEVLALCGLTGVREEMASALPIGLARMMELARAIVDPPRVLLLDEPTSGLDDTESARLGERIQQIRREKACAVLLVEHNVGFVMSQCDRVAVLDLGRILTVGKPQEVQANPAVRNAYLGE